MVARLVICIAIGLICAACSKYDSWFLLQSESISHNGSLTVFVENSQIVDRPYLVRGEAPDEVVSRTTFPIELTVDQQNRVSAKILRAYKCPEVEQCEDFPRRYAIGLAGRLEGETTIPFSNINGREGSEFVVHRYSNLKNRRIDEDQCLFQVKMKNLTADALSIDKFRDIVKIESSPIHAGMSLVFFLKDCSNAGDIFGNIEKVYPIWMSMKNIIYNENDKMFEGIFLLDIAKETDGSIYVIVGLKNEKWSTDFSTFFVIGMQDGVVSELPNTIWGDRGGYSHTPVVFLDVDRRLIASKMSFRAQGKTQFLDLTIVQFEDLEIVKEEIQLELR